MISPQKARRTHAGRRGPLGEHDTAMCRPLEDLLRGLEQLSTKAALLAEEARVAFAGHAADAPDPWGLSEDVARRHLDPEVPLTFHTLVSSLETVFSGFGLPEHTVSVAAACLLEPALGAP
ncbi:hypothetical protein [Lentzea sp. NPDC004782]|uniref:hypothetical protein n=1 Tax=Lentzea sp. NPDC004782 TaxID=3154458 RepID=UPI0033A49BFC